MNVSTLYSNNEIININTYLEKCGIKDIEEYLNPTGKYIENCNLYKCEDACNEILYWSKVENSKIVIVQDCDADGVCSTIILYQYLKQINSDFDISILIHTSKQRGLNDVDIMNQIKVKNPDLVIVPDAGTNDEIYAKELQDLGIGLIVLDHHSYKTPIKNGYLINNQDTTKSMQRNGSGCLVVHKFLQKLDNLLGVNWSGRYIDLVALSLISDSMDMTEMENREYYHYGIENRNNINNHFLGSLFDNFIGTDEYTQKDISFKVIPKINSICRHSNMQYKQRLILAFLGLDNENEVLEITSQAHKDQISTVNNIIENNKEQIDNSINNNLVVFANNDIPNSYSGLVCGKILNMSNRKPSIVGSIKDGLFIGSLRSPIPLRADLDNNELVEWAEGHEDSCGVCIKEINIQPLVDYYNTLDLSYNPQIQVLQSYSIKSIPNRLYGLFDRYNKLWTNQGISEPKFYITNILFNPTNNINILGKTKRTIKITTDQADIMLFNCTKEDKENLHLGYYEDDCFVSNPTNKTYLLNCICTLSINEWCGHKYPQIIIDKYEIKEYNHIIKKENIF